VGSGAVVGFTLFLVRFFSVNFNQFSPSGNPSLPGSGRGASIARGRGGQPGPRLVEQSERSETARGEAIH
jgi:hypothetical protein